MSIVLVIIGLIIGGIITGKSLIANSELKTVISDVSSFKTKSLSFLDKYDYLPGDIPNAWVVFGSVLNIADREPHLCISSAHCNGDGDSLVTYYGGTHSSLPETQKYWDHLHAADMWNGGEMNNLGKSSYSGSCHRPIYGRFLGRTGHMLSLGRGTYCTSAVLTNQQAYTIDKKMDDGHGARGNVRARTTGAIDCVTTGNYGSPTNNTYILENGGVACSMRFFWLD